MSKLTKEELDELPDSEFGLPEKRSYPIPDRSHARNALARAAEALKKKWITPEEYAKIVRRARKVLYDDK